MHCFSMSHLFSTNTPNVCIWKIKLEENMKKNREISHKSRHMTNMINIQSIAIDFIIIYRNFIEMNRIFWISFQSLHPIYSGYNNKRCYVWPQVIFIYSVHVWEKEWIFSCKRWTFTFVRYKSIESILLIDGKIPCQHKNLIAIYHLYSV